MGSSKEGVIVAITEKTIILHCKKLSDRKTHMVSQLEKHEFSNYRFFEDFDGNELTDDIIREHCVRIKDDPKMAREKTAIYEKIFPNIMSNLKEMTVGEISLAIKYGKLFQELSKEDGDYFILLEDDAILCENFEHMFRIFLERTPSDWDAIYLGNGAGLTPQTIHGMTITDDKIAYHMDHPASRCTDSIVMKKKTVCDLAKTWFPFNLPSDWEVSYHHHLHNHKVYWWHPSLVRQGSQNGMYATSLK
jgi:GR25 family glycosyltransferase involved in LPS biosynthesis